MATRAILFGAVGTAGQRCTSTRRIIVQKSIANDLTQRLSRSSNNVYQLSSQVEELSQQVETQSKELRFELKQATGQLSIAPTTTIAEVQENHPHAEEILASFHMGGCQSCAVSPEETIAAACARLDVNQTALLAALRNGAPAEPLRLTNIALQ